MCETRREQDKSSGCIWIGGGAALKLSGGSTGLANELSGRGEVKGRNKEELRKIELEKVKMEREGRGMEGSPRQSS